VANDDVTAGHGCPLSRLLPVFCVHFISECSELVSVSVVYMKLVIDSLWLY